MSYSLLRVSPIVVLLLLVAVFSPVESYAAQLTLTWVDNSTDEDGFKIERDVGPTGTFVGRRGLGLV